MRALSACLVLLWFASPAWAGKPKIGVLGLEVAPVASGEPDPATQQVARDLTRALRELAAGDTSPYVVAPNSDKELLDEKLLMSCRDEAASCMAVIGAGLAVDALLYGRIERGAQAYQLSLHLLDVKARTVHADADALAPGEPVAGVASRLFNRLVRDRTITGTLVVTARTESGTVLHAGTVVIDGAPRAELSTKTLMLAGVADGSHVVSIEADGLPRFERRMIVRGGQLNVLDAVLRERAPASHVGLWKISASAGVGLAVLGGGFALYSYYQREDAVSHLGVEKAAGAGDDYRPVKASDCGKSVEELRQSHHVQVNNPGELDRACRWTTRMYIGDAVLAVGVVGAAVSLIMLAREPDPSELEHTAARAHRRRVAITPVVTPEGGGATLSVTW